MNRYQMTRGRGTCGLYDTERERVVIAPDRDTAFGVAATRDTLERADRLASAYPKARRAHVREYRAWLADPDNPEKWRAYMDAVHATARAMAG